MTVKHDLVFFEKRSTPKVLSRGKSFTAPESYGKQTLRRAATPEEEKWMRDNPGKWLRVDQSGKKGGEEGYKKTKMAGREHLVHSGASFAEEYLAHYGKKGMKWGVIRDKVTMARDANTQKSIAKFESRAADLNTKISTLKSENAALVGNSSPGSIYKRYGNNTQIKELSKQRDAALKDAEAKKNGKLTSTQKKLVIGGVTVAAIGGAVAYGNAKESGLINSIQVQREAKREGRDDIFKTNAKLARKDMSADDILKEVSRPVNPNYKTPGGQMNCRRSTYAHELRRRGYDVAATPAPSGRGQSQSGVINATTPGSKNFVRGLSASRSVQAGERTGTRVSGVASGDKRKDAVERQVIRGLERPLGSNANGERSTTAPVLRELEKQPNGARGEVLFNFGTFGHSMAYEIIGGKAHIFDSQKANHYDANKGVETKWDGFHSAEVTRLDNVKLDTKFLSRWATNTG